MIIRNEENFATFSGLINLAAEKMGAVAMAASDEFFSQKENLLRPGRGIYLPDEFTQSGKWMDGWESRRSRRLGHDWCIIKLAVAGEIRAVDVDTHHFRGNSPQFISVDAYFTDQDLSGDELEQVDWVDILPQLTVIPDSQNLFAIRRIIKATHLRLKIYPDGGVARFRCYGHAQPLHLTKGSEIDLVSIQNGGKAIICSDMFFASMNNLINPGRAIDMSDGWETRRERTLNHDDWVVLRLAALGKVNKIEVDTGKFMGNAPAFCSVEGTVAPDGNLETLIYEDNWRPLLPKVALEPDQQHFFGDLAAHDPLTHVRLTIFPDGGISRLRVFGILV